MVNVGFLTNSHEFPLQVAKHLKKLQRWIANP